MTTIIILSASDAGVVRGPSATVEGAALEPVALSDGRFILPLVVLDDPAHSPHWALLSGLPTSDLASLSATE
jgi:hypothetical protein